MSTRHEIAFSDAWIQEVEEASRLIQDLETKTKNSETPRQQSLRESAGLKLLELAPKLDRLESLLYNPPAKPILTDQNFELRQSMLLEIQLRMKSVVMDLYSIKHTYSHGSLPSTEAKKITKAGSNTDQDYIVANA